MITGASEKRTGYNERHMSIHPLHLLRTCWSVVEDAGEYRQPRLGRSAFELFVTSRSFRHLLGSGLLFSLANGFWPGLIAIPSCQRLPAPIVHDPARLRHASFFARGARDWIGRVLGILTLTPYDYWRRAHAAHHATAGNLDQRGVGDIATLTIAEYRALFAAKRPRLPRCTGTRSSCSASGRPGSSYSSNACRSDDELGCSALDFDHGDESCDRYVGRLDGVGRRWDPFLLIHFRSCCSQVQPGVWLFYVQHQFEPPLVGGRGLAVSSGGRCMAPRTTIFRRVLRWLTAI